ncbi:ricin-like [Mercurialis annua]|uniref:ricin-like n=1 Tax=Mercurialis annua TaxID=3986 RepID=UPI00215F5DB8|nr:ricin-like [Mercurialis annua]XP_050205050.1 ricin-like [Mercurialis annua]
MKGYEHCLWLCLLAIWFHCGSTTVWSITTAEYNQTIFPSFNDHPIVKLDVNNLNWQSYDDFIIALRNALRNPNEDVRNWHGYGVLRSTQNLPESRSFLLVELSVPDIPGATITFAVNVTNMYIIGFLVGDRAHYFPGYDHDIQIAFPNVPSQNRHVLPFEENYNSLESAAHEDRSTIYLGKNPLIQAVRQLYYASRDGHISPAQRAGPAKWLLVCIQMISEAARNFIIAGRISSWIDNLYERAAEPDMISYQNRWGKLSERIQESGENGVFDAVDLVDRTNQPMDLSNVNDFYVRFAIALMIYYCQPQPKLIHHLSPLIIQPAVAMYDDVCVNPEDPIVRIVGPNGLCAGVINGDYRNRKAIVLQPCKSNSDESQLWTFKRNGMIQSKGKCLTCYGNQPGNYIMINDCPSQLTDVTKWQVWDNGTIVSGTGLVLSANAGDEGTILRVEANIYTTAQSWRPTSYTQPLVTSIVGLNRLCLQATGDGVWLDKCVAGKQDQTWIVYPDGSVRPQRNKGDCLFGDLKHDRVVRIVACYPLSVGQRWVFKSDGSIVNLNYGLVLDVLRSDPSLKQIVIWDSTGNANQKWSFAF